MTEENKFSLKSGNSNFLNKTENFTINYPNENPPVKLFSLVDTLDFLEGILGPSTPNVSFTKTLVLDTKIQWCWIAENRSSVVGSTIPGSPVSSIGCLVTEDYSNSLRSAVNSQGFETNPSGTNISYMNILNQTYTSLGNWLFGTYSGESVFLNSVLTTASKFYTESVYIDNSGINSLLVFKFKTTSTCDTQVDFNTAQFMVFYQ